MLDYDKINRYKELMGYYQIVTMKLELDELDVRKKEDNIAKTTTVLCLLCTYMSTQ